jgi:RecA/RadA recombinase
MERSPARGQVPEHCQVGELLLRVQLLRVALGHEGDEESTNAAGGPVSRLRSTLSGMATSTMSHGLVDTQKGPVDAHGEPLDRLAEQAHRQGVLSLAQLLEQPRLELLGLADMRLSAADIDRLVESAALGAAPTILTAKALRASPCAHVRTALPTLDTELGGGLAVGTLTEVSGAAGCGKSQLCMHLSAHALLDDARAHVVFIDTERSFRAVRFAQIVGALDKPAPSALAGEAAAAPHSALERFHLFQPLSSQQLDDALQAVSELAEGPNRVRLLVLDSIGALLRAEFDGDTRLRRFESLTAISASLKRLAALLGAAVIVTNQVLAMIDDDVSAPCGELEGQTGGRLQPSLGVTWAHNVNTRLLFECVPQRRSREGRSKPAAAPGDGVLGAVHSQLPDDSLHDRSIRIEKSPKSAQATVAVAIGPGGLYEPGAGTLCRASLTLSPIDPGEV